MRVLFVLVLLATAGEAAAQPGATPPAPPKEEPNPYAEPGDETPAVLDEGTVDDPVAGRAWFAPTALTPPAGSISVSSTEILILSGSWSPANTIQISVNSFLPVLFDDAAFAGTASVKMQLLRSPRLRVSGYALGLFADGVDNDSNLFGGALGGVASFCLDERCDSLLSAFAAASFARGGDNDLPVFLTASWIQRIHPRIKLVFEALGTYLGGEIDGVGSGALVTGGARFVNSFLAIELAVAGAIDDGGDSAPLPWFSLTFRGGI